MKKKKENIEEIYSSAPLSQFARLTKITFFEHVLSADLMATIYVVWLVVYKRDSR